MLVSLSAATAQEIDATVSVNVDRLSAAAQNELGGFAQEMERYINTTRWTDEQWEGPKVKMNFSVIFTNEGPGGSYGAQLIVGSQRDVHQRDVTSPVMKLLDENWVFRYARSQPFYQDASGYDELTGLIDFYIYLALGLDLDTYSDQGGTKMYERARDIANRASLRGEIAGWSTDVKAGRYSRYGIVQELTNLRYKAIREFLFNYHYNGLDLLAEKPQEALVALDGYLGDLVKAVDKLVEPSTLVRMLGDSKHVEYAEIFRGYRNDMLWRKLMYLDPGHTTLYEEARDAR